MLTRPIIEIAPKTWLISEYKLVNMYLLEGDERALLIDSGTGIGPLYEDVKKLTDKPVTLVLTHSHFDHDGGVKPFGRLYVHKADLSTPNMLAPAGMRSLKECREYYVRSRGIVRNPGCEDELMQLVHDDDGKVERIPIEDGYTFDLGNRTVEVIHTPGHSKGSICLLDPKTRLLFTGDTCNDCLLIYKDPTITSVEVYNAGLKRLWARQNEFDAICIGHDALAPANKNAIREYIEATDALLDGTACGKEDSDGIHSGICYRYGGIRIFYTPDNLRAYS